MEAIIAKGKQATYHVTHSVVPPNPRDKVYIDTPIAFLAVNVDTGEEHREVIELRQGYSNADLQAALNIFKTAAATTSKSISAPWFKGDVTLSHAVDSELFTCR